MRDTELLQVALGLAPPWQVSEAEFDPDEKRLDIRLDFPKGSTFTCPACGQIGLKAYDTTEKTWRHLNFFQHEAYLTARVARIDCDQCGTHLVDVPWARPGSGFTLLFEAMIMVLAKAMPVKTIAAFVNEHDTRLWRILHHYLEQLTIKKLNLKTSRAYHIRLNFQELYQHPAEFAETFLKKWYFWATHSRLEPIINAAKTIKNHWDGVLRWFTSKINNGILEGINSLIQAAKARARGYRTERTLITYDLSYCR